MKFIETELPGAFIIELQPFVDHRGTFARTFCAQEFQEHGLDNVMVQSNWSVSLAKHTLRGMHYQVAGAEEAKLVRCTRGSILDVIIDLRRDSPTFARHIRVELTDSNNRSLYVPRGFAHGFLSLEDNCQVLYQVTNFYAPGEERGIRWNDPFFNIPWPVSDPIISQRDAASADYVAVPR